VSPLALLAVLAGCAVLAGRAAVEGGLGPPPPRAPGEGLFRGALAVALGAGLVSAACTALRMAGAPPHAAALLGAVAPAVAGGLALLRRRGRRDPPAPPAAPPAPRAAWALLAAVGAVAAVCVADRVLARPDGGWDAVMIWGLRARMLLHAPSLREALPPEVATAHPDYPLLLPGLVAQAWALAAGEHPAIGAALGLGLAAALVALLLGALRRAGAALLAPAAAALLVATPWFVELAPNQEADVAVALFVLAAGALAATAPAAAGAERARQLALAGLAASLAAWTKNEGLLLALALGAGVLLARDARRTARARGQDLLAFAAGAAPVLALLVAFKVGFAPPSALVVGDPWAAKLGRALDPWRAVMVLRHVGRRVLYFQGWGVALPAVLLAGAALAARGRAGRGPLAAAGAIAWAGLLGVYLATPLDLRWHVYHSADRLLFQWWPLLLFGVARALAGELALGPGPRGP
jgi:hypothetical protein